MRKVTKYGMSIALAQGNEAQKGNINTRPTEVKIGATSRVTALGCGGFHTAAVTARGELFTFGRGDSGQLGLGTLGQEQFVNVLFPMRVTSILQKVTKIACGVDHTICCTGMHFLKLLSTPILTMSSSRRDVWIWVKCKRTARDRAISPGVLFSSPAYTLPGIHQEYFYLPLCCCMWSSIYCNDIGRLYIYVGPK